MANERPQHFDEAFLRWFREQTEDAWRTYQTRTFEDFAASGVGGDDWQTGTCWSGGLSEQEIVAIEQQYHVRFPPDYRLFLQVLHSLDRPQTGARYAPDGKTLLPVSMPSFYHWQRDTEAIAAAFEWLVEGLYFDVQHNHLWPQSWGARPVTAEAQQARVRELVENAPKLIPILGHRYLLAEPCEDGNPVLSVYQSDIIIYGVNLYDYFLTEFGDLTGVGSSYGSQLTQEKFEKYQTIPFWGEFL